MKRSSIARRAGLAAAAALALVLLGAQPSFGWSSSVTYSHPGLCTSGSLAGSSWYPAPYESRASSAADGSCSAYFVITGHRPPLSASLRYASGGASAGASTVTDTYVTTTGWSHYSYYLGGLHRWDNVTLYT
jgi:hypothetical protein